MKKIYKIVSLLILFIFLTTYTSSGLNFFPEKENIFFKIRNIEIENTNIINSRDVNEKLAHIYGRNILFIKRDELEKPLKSFDFLESIEVKKKYPNTIIIKIYETKPVALIFKNNQKYLIDTSSNLILFEKKISIEGYPTIFGEDGEKSFIKFLKKLEKNNFPTKRVKNYYYFKIGRWDVHLLNGQIIKFPTNKTTKVIKQSIDLLKREDFKNYNVIDLRIHGKIVVK